MHLLQRLLVAMAGVQVGHAIIHAFPHPHPNDAAHGYLPMAAAVVMPLGVLALVALIRTQWRTKHRHVRPLEIAALQVFLFAGQEVLETVSLGGAPAGFLTDTVMWSGVAVQVAIGWIIVSTLSLATTAIQFFLTFTGFLTPIPAAGRADTTGQTAPASHLLANCSLVRGPPQLTNA